MSQLLASPEKLFIDGRWTNPNSSARFVVHDAATDDPFMTVAEADRHDMDRAVTSARTAFDRGVWPRLSYVERAKYLTAIARELDARSADLGTIWTSETGTLSTVAKVGSAMVAKTFDYYASLAESYPFEQVVRRTDGDVGLLVREPVGVVAAIIPWNVPASLMAYKCAPALLAGCTIVLKGSPEAPGATYVMAEICEKIGLPPGVVNVVTADREVSELLVRDARIDKVTFTGSTAAGRRIGAICGERVARCTLELGGKSAAVVMDDYDVGQAAAIIAGRATILTGQVCASLTRIVVNRSQHDRMVEALSAEFAKVRVGDPRDPATQMGPLATQQHLKRVQGLIARGIEEGAVLAGGGGRPSHLDRGCFIEPTVFGNVDNASTIAREEIFGPVISVIPVDSEKHAIEVANDSPFGLNASVFTNDSDRAYAAARELRCGTVSQNGYRSDFSIAFGGFKQSGIGREGGTEGMLPFLETKTVLLSAAPTHSG